jgi:hypothetical protein
VKIQQKGKEEIRRGQKVRSLLFFALRTHTLLCTYWDHVQRLPTLLIIAATELTRFCPRCSPLQQQSRLYSNSVVISCGMHLL